METTFEHLIGFRDSTVQCNSVTFTRHAIERMFSRAIDVAEVTELIAKGEMIADYPYDRPYPSALLLGFVGPRPVHVVVAKDERTSDCYVVTAYVPEAETWNDGFRTRKKQ
jgi:hypothetical protein